MKRILLLFIVSILTLSGCSSAEDSMVLKPTELSQDTENLLSIVEDELKYYEFSVDETVNSVSYDVWGYQDDEWVSLGKTYGRLDSKDGNLAVKISGDSYTLYNFDESGHSSYETPDVGIDFSENTMHTYGWEENPIDIELDREILLYSKYGTNANSIATNSYDFRSVECDNGIAITITFSADEVD